MDQTVCVTFVRLIRRERLSPLTFRGRDVMLAPFGRVTSHQFALADAAWNPEPAEHISLVTKVFELHGCRCSVNYHESGVRQWNIDGSHYEVDTLIEHFAINTTDVKKLAIRVIKERVSDGWDPDRLAGILMNREERLVSPSRHGKTACFRFMWPRPSITAMIEFVFCVDGPDRMSKLLVKHRF